MPVIGTAGHVDHGKSTLILALTGRDPDRWEEEKRRGLTIDLGFAWTTLPGGTEVSFVDVPGHERFIKNMLAGVEAIDAALFVVAADEGWAAQSEEHLAVLDLLEIRHGVIALTKVDRVDPEVIELGRLEISERLAGTSLAAAPVVAVSATTGEGMDELRSALEAAAVAGSPQPTGRPRMWIDRSFSIAGAGTVVTGTLLGGGLEVGTTIEVWPAAGTQEAETARIRGLETHEAKVEHADPHRRVAANLVGIERGEITRGAMLGKPGEWAATQRFLAQFRTPRYLEELAPRGAFQVHIGSGAWPLRLRQIEPGIAVCELSSRLCLQVGDRFILRDTGRRTVVGGGQVLDPAPPRKGPAIRASAQTLINRPRATPDQIADALLAVRRTAFAATLAAHSGGGSPREAMVADDQLVHTDEAIRLTTILVEEVARFHETNPLRPGIGVPQLSGRLATSPAVVEALARSDHRLALDQGLVALARRQATIDPTADPAWIRARSVLHAAGLTVPRIAELGLNADLFHALVRAGELVKIGADLAYLPSQVDELLAVLVTMPTDFTVSAFREAAGISRKYAVPFLEWTDSTGRTIRQSDRRTARKAPT
ncbi:MAG: selenocysteine-specific translation elongation factor [Acidimicrobiia bacterium]|nr:selenocysteine-specific translation elongation factor [Acidimicrobiia bacterium]